MLSWPTGWTLLWTRPTPSGTATGRRSETPELIQLAKNMRQANARGEKLALYDALETNDSAVQVLGDETLCEIGRELVDTVRGKLLAENAPNADVRPSLSKLAEAIAGITHIKLPGSKQRTILDESHRSISHGCRQPSNQAHKTISRRGELAAPGSGGGSHHVCTPFKLLRARTSPLVASLHL